MTAKVPPPWTQADIDAAWHEGNQIAKLQGEVNRRMAEWLARYSALADAKASRGVEVDAASPDGSAVVRGRVRSTAGGP